MYKYDIHFLQAFASWSGDRVATLAALPGINHNWILTAGSRLGVAQMFVFLLKKIVKKALVVKFLEIANTF